MNWRPNICLNNWCHSLYRYDITSGDVTSIPTMTLIVYFYNPSLYLLFFLDILFNLVQCPLGFATLGKAAALALATSRALTDLCQYINSDLGFSDLEIWLLYSK